MVKVKRIINTLSMPLCLESGLILAAHSSESSIRENVEIGEEEKQRLARWCVIVEDGDNPTEQELQSQVFALIQAEKKRQYENDVQSDSYWYNQKVQAVIHDCDGEDKERPRLSVDCSPDYSGGSKHFDIDINASIKRDIKNIASPLILPVIDHWQACVRLFKKSDLHKKGSEMYAAAKDHLSRIAPTALESAEEQALPKDAAFLRLINNDTLGGQILFDASDISEELFCLWLAWGFMKEDSAFNAIADHNEGERAHKRLEALKRDLEAHRYAQPYASAREKILGFFKQNTSPPRFLFTLPERPERFDELNSQYLSWRFETLGTRLQVDSVKKYFRGARRWHSEDATNETGEMLPKRFDAAPLQPTFELEKPVAFIHHIGTTLDFYFASIQDRRATFLLSSTKTD